MVYADLFSSPAGTDPLAAPNSEPVRPLDGPSSSTSSFTDCSVASAIELFSPRVARLSILGEEWDQSYLEKIVATHGFEPGEKRGRELRRAFVSHILSGSCVERRHHAGCAYVASSFLSGHDYVNALFNALLPLCTQSESLGCQLGSVYGLAPSVSSPRRSLRLKTTPSGGVVRGSELQPAA